MILDFATASKLALIFLVSGTESIPTPFQWDQKLIDVNGRDVNVAKEVYQNFQNRPSTFMNQLTVDGANTLLTAATKNPTDRGLARSFMKLLRVSDFMGMPSNVCSIFGQFIDMMSAEVVKKLDAECVKEIIQGNKHAKFFTGIPAKWVDEFGLELTNLIANNPIGIPLLPAATWQAIFTSKEHEDLCSSFTVKHLESIHKETRKLVSPMCMKHLSDVKTTAFRANRFPANAFELFVEGVHADTAAQMTADQLKNFGVKADNDAEICAAFPLSSVKKSAIGSVTANCLKSYLSTETPANLGKLWKFIPADTIKSIDGENFKFMKNLNAVDFASMPKEVIESIFAKDIFEHLPENVDHLSTSAKTMNINAKTFAVLVEKAPAMAGWILHHVKDLDNEILSTVDAESFSKITTFVEGSDLSGVQLLDVQYRRSNIGSIIANMSKSAGDSHICSLFKQHHEYLEMRVRPHFTAECRKAVGFDKSDSDFLSKAPEFANNDEAIEKILSTYTPSNWYTMSGILLGVLTREEAFCKSFTTEIFKHLDKKNYEFIGPKCVVKIVDSITKDNVATFGADFAANLEAEHMKNFSAADLTPAQISNVSVNVDATKNAFSSVNGATLAAMNGDQVAAMTAPQWAALPTAAFAHIDAAHVPTIPANSLTRLQDSQMDNFTEAVVLAFTPAQITSIGKETNAKLSVFHKYAAKLSAEAKSALDSRKTESSGMGKIWYFVIGGVVIVIIAAAVYFFVAK